MNRLKDKVAIITGATSLGIGRETALKLSSEGAVLTITGRNEYEGQKTSDMVINEGGKCIYIKHDVSIEENWKEVIQETINVYGSIDYLVNNAGQFWIKPIAETSLDDFKQICSVNIDGTWLGMKHCLDKMNDGGAIVNVSSSAAIGAHAWTAAYSASKGGISAFSKTLAVEYGMRGLNVNCVCPASIQTPMSTNPEMPKDIDTRLLKKIMPLDGVNRSPDDIASTIAFLASEDAIHINGIDLRVDGGLLT